MKKSSIDIPTNDLFIVCMYNPKNDSYVRTSEKLKTTLNSLNFNLYKIVPIENEYLTKTNTFNDFFIHIWKECCLVFKRSTDISLEDLIDAIEFAKYLDMNLWIKEMNGLELKD